MGARKLSFRILLIITGAAVAILLLAGCGPSATPTPTPKPTVEELMPTARPMLTGTPTRRPPPTRWPTPTLTPTPVPTPGPTPTRVLPTTHPCAPPWWSGSWEYPDLTHSVKITPQVAAFGETVLIKQTMENTGGQHILLRTSSFPYGFLVTKPNGDYVMDDFCHIDRILIWDIHSQRPGEVWEYTYKWDQRDVWGQQVPPGVYLVQGMFLGPPDSERPDKMWLTEPVRVAILPR